MRARESDGVNKGLAQEQLWRKEETPLPPCDLGRNLLAPLYPDLGYSQATGKARAESEPSSPHRAGREQKQAGNDAWTPL